MTHAVAALAVPTISAILYIVLGAWVLTLTPRRRQTTLLGVFAIVFGLIYVPLDVLSIFHAIEVPSLAQSALQAPFSLLAWLVALAMAVSVPGELEDRRLLVVAVAVGVGIGAAGFLYNLIYGFASVTGALAGLVSVAFALGEVAEAAALVLLALRARPSEGRPRDEVAQLAILAVAFVTLNAFGDGTTLGSTAPALSVQDPIRGGLLALLELDELLVAGGIWGWNMFQVRDETVRIHRNVVLSILGIVTAGALYAAATPTDEVPINPYNTVARGVMRTLGVGLLAYGVLRHDLAGLDEKVEFGVSRTTVAGVFVAVFFVVSEGAQVLLAGFAGSELLGVLAAGALVFVLAPIQRAADDLAEAVVPGGEPTAQSAAGVEDRYRGLVEATLADGEITEDEERHLLEKADELGIPAARAYDLRRQVEDEADAGGDEP